MQTDPFIDEIYEAAVVPEKWQAILDRLAENGRRRGRAALCRMSGCAPMDFVGGDPAHDGRMDRQQVVSR